MTDDPVVVLADLAAAASSLSAAARIVGGAEPYAVEAADLLGRSAGQLRVAAGHVG